MRVLPVFPWITPGKSGDGEIRTLDPLLARQVLSQLSYTPATSQCASLLFVPRILGTHSRFAIAPFPHKSSICGGPVSKLRSCSPDACVGLATAPLLLLFPTNLRFAGAPVQGSTSHADIYM